MDNTEIRNKIAYTCKISVYSWVEISFCSGSPHVARSTEPHLAHFFILICRVHKTMSRGFLARCHHGLCSDIVYRPLRNIKNLIDILFRTGPVSPGRTSDLTYPQPPWLHPNRESFSRPAC